MEYKFKMTPAETSFYPLTLYGFNAYALEIVIRFSEFAKSNAFPFSHLGTAYVR